LNQRPLGYEPFSNQQESQRATKKASEINASHVVGFGALWLSLGSNFLGNSWVKSGWVNGDPEGRAHPSHAPCYESSSASTLSR